MAKVETLQETQPEHAKQPKGRSASPSRVAKEIVQETQLKTSEEGNARASASRGRAPHEHSHQMTTNTPDMTVVVADKVEDSECEGPDKINQIDFSGQLSDINVTLRRANASVDTTEFPLLGEAMAAGSSKKKGRSGQPTGHQGQKVQNPPSAEPQSTAQPTAQPLNLAAAFDEVSGAVKEGAAEVVGGSKADPSPPSVRHHSKSRGPKKDQAANSVRKKIGKSRLPTQPAL